MHWLSSVGSVSCRRCGEGLESRPAFLSLWELSPVVAWLVPLVSLALPCHRSSIGEDSFPAFDVHTIDPDAAFCACAVMDVNHDGQPDIISGGWWYQGPNWQRHFLREVPIIRGRFDDYSNLVVDVDGDGWDDLISANYRSQTLFWIRHPGPGLGPWDVRVIAEPGPMETGRLYDIDGDGQPDVLPNGATFAAWWRFTRAQNGAVEWHRHDLPAEMAGHGIGFGDINADGRGDIVTAAGWWESPPDPRSGAWTYHPEFRLHSDASVPILVHDLDRDGDNDVIWGRGHNVGIYWLEQITEGNVRGWRWHAIDTSWSQAHALLLADLDADGTPEVVTGKRYLGHDGRDPGEWDMPVVYAYQFDPQRRVFHRHPIAEGINVGWGLDPKAADLDGDGDVDLVAADRNGFFWFENLKVHPTGSAEQEQKAVDAWMKQDHRDPMTLVEENGQRRQVVSLGDWGRRRWHILRGMEAAMGELPNPSFRVPLDIRIVTTEETAEYRRIKLTYAADPFDRLPAYLLIPQGSSVRRPGVLCLHQTTPLGKDEPAGTKPEAVYPYAHELASLGYVCLVPDYPSFGEHTYDFSAHPEFASGTMKAIWDNIRGIDLLESLPEVDGDKIAVIGHSLGGHNALFTAAFDERIRAVICSCSFTAFHDYYGGKIAPWAQDRYMPRVREVFQNDPDRMPFDFYEVVAAIAPRPLFVSGPLNDANFDYQGVRKVLIKAREVYALYGAEDKLTAIHPELGHGFPPEIRQQAYAWLARQLKWSLTE